MASWKDVCLTKKENTICDQKQSEKLNDIQFSAPFSINKYRTMEYICIKYNTPFNDWFNFYEKELFNLYRDIRNYIVERGYITAADVNENFIKFTKLIYLHSSTKLS